MRDLVDRLMEFLSLRKAINAQYPRIQVLDMTRDGRSFLIEDDGMRGWVEKQTLLNGVWSD